MYWQTMYTTQYTCIYKTTSWHFHHSDQFFTIGFVVLLSDNSILNLYMPWQVLLNLFFGVYIYYGYREKKIHWIFDLNLLKWLLPLLAYKITFKPYIEKSISHEMTISLVATEFDRRFIVKNNWYRRISYYQMPILMLKMNSHRKISHKFMQIVWRCRLTWKSKPQWM